MKRLFAILLLLCMAVTAALAEAPENVEAEEALPVCGDYTYEVLEDGTAKIVKYNTTSEFIVIPAKLDDYAVSVIGSKAFEDCKAKAITVPEGVVKLEEAAFLFSGVTRLTLPDSLTIFDDGAFRGCSRLDTVVLSASNTALKVENRALIDTQEQRLLAILWGEFGTIPFNQADYTVPDGVRSIDMRALSGSSVIETVALPDTVSRIGASAFESSGKLRKVTFYESAVGSDAEKTGFTMGSYAFSGCRSLESFVIPADVVEIADGTFFRCMSMKECPLPAGLEQIGTSAFYDCASLEEAILPDGFRSVGYAAFQGCTSLKKLRLPASLEKVGANAFSGCERLQTIRTGINVAENMCSGMTGLKSVEIAEGVTSIGRNGFKGCTALETITLPASLMEIGATAFEGCTALKTITLPAGLMSIDGTAFKDCGEISFVVPANSYAEQYAIYYGIPYTLAE